MRRRILTPIEKEKAKVFSDEWVEKNAWMGKANEEAIEEVEQKLSSLERFKALPHCFINFPNGIPMPKIKAQMKQIRDFMQEQEERLAIFNEMLGEKGIRAGRNGVGEPYRGWGRSARK